MYPETLDTGHRVIWSHPAHARSTDLVLILHDADSTCDTAAEHYFEHLPDATTGLAIHAGHDATFGHSWFSSREHTNPNFPEIIAAAHRVFDAIDDDEYGTTAYTSIQVLGVGQGAALATTLLRVRPEAITAVIGINGYVMDNPMLAALDSSEASMTTTPVLWVATEASGDSRDFARDWLTTHTTVTEAETPSAITPFLLQNVS